VRLFGPLYDRVMRLSAHRRAPWFLGGLSFAESSFFPVPPDIMLIPMVAATPGRYLRLALITTLASVLGGALGYAIGVFAIDLVQPLIEEMGHAEAYAQATAWFGDWGFWAVLLAGFSPIPYKIFTITAGALSLAWLPFLLASFVGRGARFFLLAALVARFGPTMEPIIRRYVEWLGWLMVGLAGLAYFWFRGHG